jgi:hypothetical protein
MEELRFPNLRSPETDSPYNSNGTSNREQNTYFSNLHSSNDARTSLQRRFTTDSSKMSGARPFGQQYPPVNSTAVRHMSLCHPMKIMLLCLWRNNSILWRLHWPQSEYWFRIF